jgi:hypothetical protein
MINEKQIAVVKSSLGYRGKKIYLRKYSPGMCLNSYWSEGCRDYFFFVNVITGQYTSVPQNGTMFDRLNLKSPENLEDNQVLVMQSIYRGKKGGLFIYSQEPKEEPVNSIDDFNYVGSKEHY